MLNQHELLKLSLNKSSHHFLQKEKEKGLSFSLSRESKGELKLVLGLLYFFALLFFTLKLLA
jgi:hypothetical protein